MNNRFREPNCFKYHFSKENLSLTLGKILMAILIILCLSIWIKVIVATFTPLYSESDKPYIHIIDNSNFTQFLAGPDPHSKLPSATWVQFYNSWCGHCQKFSPIFKSLATDVKDWSSVIKLAVIDCAEDRNAEICREFAIYMYPSLRYFPPKFKAIRDYSIQKPADFKIEQFGEGPEITGVRYDGDLDTIGPLKKGMITALMTTYSNTTIVPSHWPSLNALSASTKSQLVRLLPIGDAIPILLVVEPLTSSLASELILDFSSKRDKVKIFRVTNESEQLLKEIFPDGYSGSATLIELIRKPDYSFKVLCCDGQASSRDKDLRSTFSSIIIHKFLPHLVTKSPHTNSDQIKRPDHREKISPNEIIDVNSPVYSVDLHNALRYSIYNQVTRHVKLNESQLSAFKNFLRVVQAYFPFADDKASGFIKLLNRWASSKNHYVTADEIISEMSQFEEDYSLPEMKAYKGCAGSTPRYRGYPCSLWTMFHTLTVAEYLKRNKGLPNTRSDDESEGDHMVLPAVKDFIINFFGCTECAHNFAKESDKMEDALVYPNSSVLWLWRTHNSVNKRLAGDLSEDPAHPKVQYPPRKLCTLCYKSGSSTEFNEPEVFKFLLDRYQADSIVADGTQVRSSSIDSAKSSVNSSSSSKATMNITSAYYSLLNRTDITLFVLLYASSVVLLVGLFLYFRMRGRRKKLHNSTPHFLRSEHV